MPRGIPKSAKNAIVSPVNYIDAPDQQVGQDVPRLLKSNGDSATALEAATIQPVDRPVDDEKMEMLKFMEMPVTVYIHETTDPQAEQVFEVQNNGQRELFRRGETKVVKRKFVNELATRKVTVYTQKRVQDADGVWHDKQIPRTALRYPFSVASDPHPRGADWLKATLAQA